MGTTTLIQTCWHLIPSKAADSFALGCAPIPTCLVFSRKRTSLWEPELKLPLSSGLPSAKDAPGRGQRERGRRQLLGDWQPFLPTLRVYREGSRAASLHITASLSWKLERKMQSFVHSLAPSLFTEGQDEAVPPNPIYR